MGAYSERGPYTSGSGFPLGLLAAFTIKGANTAFPVTPLTSKSR